MPILAPQSEYAQTNPTELVWSAKELAENRFWEGRYWARLKTGWQTYGRVRWSTKGYAQFAYDVILTRENGSKYSYPMMQNFKVDAQMVLVRKKEILNRAGGYAMAKKYLVKLTNTEIVHILTLMARNSEEGCCSAIIERDRSATGDDANSGLTLDAKGTRNILLQIEKSLREATSLGETQSSDRAGEL